MRTRIYALIVAILGIVALTLTVAPASAAAPAPAPDGVSGVSAWQHSPQPAGVSTTEAYRLEDDDGDGHAFGTGGTGEVWIEVHLELSAWKEITNGLPWYAYVAHTRYDQQVGPLAFHYGTCQSGKACIKVWDGYLPGTSTALVSSWVSRGLGFYGVNKGWQYPSYVAVTLNNSLYAPGASQGTAFARGMAWCAVLGEAVGARWAKFRGYSPTEGCLSQYWGHTSGTTANLWPNTADKSYLNSMYAY